MACSLCSSRRSCAANAMNNAAATKSIHCADASSDSAEALSRYPANVEPRVMKNMAATVAMKTASLPCRIASSIDRKKVLSPISVMNTARKLAGKPSSALGEEASVPSAVVEASRSQAMSPSCGLCTPRLGSMAPRAAAKRRVECGRMRRVKVKHPFPRFP